MAQEFLLWENKMADNTFLIKEYEFCFDQLRFYDNRNENLLKYLITLTTSVAMAQFAIYKLIQVFNERFFKLQLFLSVVVFIASLLLFFMMLQNRLYFVYTAKQINAIRSFYLETEATDFKNNQMYTSTNFSAFKTFSVHSFQLLGSALLCGLFFSSIIYSIINLTQTTIHVKTWCSISYIFVSIFLLIISALYLKFLGNKNADEAIHKIK